MIKVAVIGTGGIANSHLESYVSAFQGRCQIVALCDIYGDKAVQSKEKFQLDCRVEQDYRELLDSDIDLVSICTPPYTHAEIAIDFLRAGKHVLVEKPMASSMEECDRMLEAASESERILSVIGQNRFRDPIMKLKRTLDTGKLGKIVHAQVDSHWWRGHCYYDLWWRGTWEKEGGGCTLNHAVHHIDMLQWMMGMPDKVHAVMSNRRMITRKWRTSPSPFFLTATEAWRKLRAPSCITERNSSSYSKGNRPEYPHLGKCMRPPPRKTDFRFGTTPLRRSLSRRTTAWRTFRIPGTPDKSTT